MRKQRRGPARVPRGFRHHPRVHAPRRAQRVHSCRPGGVTRRETSLGGAAARKRARCARHFENAGERARGARAPSPPLPAPRSPDWRRGRRSRTDEGATGARGGRACVFQKRTEKKREEGCEEAHSVFFFSLRTPADLSPFLRPPRHTRVHARAPSSRHVRPPGARPDRTRGECQASRTRVSMARVPPPALHLAAAAWLSRISRLDVIFHGLCGWGGA